MLFHVFRKSASSDTSEQLVVETFVANQDRACGMHPGNGRADVGEEETGTLLHQVDYVLETTSPKQDCITQTSVSQPARRLFFV